MTSILITGATGFIGRELTNALLQQNFKLKLAVREKNKGLGLSDAVDICIVNNISRNTNWKEVLKDVHTVIHLAARAHILKEFTLDPLKEFQDINCGGTLNLAQQSKNNNIKRFIFISSIGVNGVETNTTSFHHNDIPNPIESYAISKYCAEKGLQKIANNGDMEVVIIRPPLVYGPNAPGNFARLIKIISRGIPLPLGAINNKRSFVSIDNLVSLISTCITSPNAANQTFLVSDDEDLSTTDLLKRLARALNKPIRLIPIPVNILTLSAKIAGKQALTRRLCSSLQIDLKHTKTTLNWKPPTTVNEALKETADAYLAQPKKDRK